MGCIPAGSLILPVLIIELKIIIQFHQKPRIVIDKLPNLIALQGIYRYGFLIGKGIIRRLIHMQFLHGADYIASL